jgi:hypothetical protein
MVDLPWQSTNKRGLETVMFRNITGLLVKWRFAAQNRPTLLLQAKLCKPLSNTAYGLIHLEGNRAT